MPPAEALSLANFGPSIRQVLQATARELPACRTLVVGDPNGLPVAAVAFAGTGPATATTAMASLALSAAVRVMDGLALPAPAHVLIESDGWSVLVMSLGGGFTLSAAVPSDAALGYVKIVLGKGAEELRKLLAAWR